MTPVACRRVRRELVARFRLANSDLADSDAELDHLSRCPECRDEVAADWALVIQLQRALSARVGDASPSHGAWLAIARGASRPETRSERRAGWWSALAGRLRMGTAISAAGLALVLSINPDSSPFQTVESQSPVPTARPSVASGTPDSVEPLERLVLDRGRGRTEVAPVFAGPAPSDGMRPAEHRFAAGAEREATESQPLPGDMGAPQPEQVPVLQQPYRSAAPAPADTPDSPEGDVIQEDGAEDPRPPVERASVRD
jgi:hypothetical protein